MLTMNKQAKGSFEVKLVPQTDRGVPGLYRMTIDKEFQGDLEAVTQGQMLSARTGVADSAGYVAIERVEGMLHGRKGSFILQHAATMDRGKPTLIIHVVPDSGTGELMGLNGQLSIQIEGGRHFYDFVYSLPAEG
jgi:hypothetical protein